MLGKGLTVGITVFWVVMMALLAKQEVLPAWRVEREAARTPNYGRLAALAEKGLTRRMGIYKGEPPALRWIGVTVSTLQKDGVEVLMTSDTKIELDLGAGSTEFRLRFEARAIGGELSSFHLDVFMTPAGERITTGRPPAVSAAGSENKLRGRPGEAKPWATVDGVPEEGTLKLRIKEGGTAQEMTVPFDSRRVLSNLLSPTFTPAQLRAGESWAFSGFDPLSYGVGTATARVTGKERIQVGGKEEDTYLIHITSGGYEADVWADAEGEVVKEKVMGFTMLRE